MNKEGRTSIELSERNESRMYKRFPTLNRGRTINSEFATLISIFFIGPGAFYREIFVSVRTDGGTWTRGTVDRPIDQRPYRSAPHSARIIRTCERWYPFSPASLLPLIHSFTLSLSLLVPPLNLYAGAYSARSLSVIDAHSIRLRTPVNLLDAVFVLNYFARRGTEKGRWRKRRRGAGREPR